MNILVTGGAGFIGFHLCKKLLLDGHNVICIDNFYTGKKENVAELEKLDDGQEARNFKFIEHDINQQIQIEDEIDQIYNLACPASPVHYQNDPVETTKTNVVGVINILNLAKSKGAKVLQASTSEIYGDPEVHPQQENYNGNVNTLGVRACYDEGKRCAETLFMDFHRQHNTDIKIVRIFNTYGPYMYEDDGRVISNFIIQALKGKDVTVYGDGAQTRCFQYIDDLIEGMIKMMDTQNFIGPVNLGNPNEISIKELAEKIIEITGSNSQIVFKDLPEDDPKKRKPDISLAKGELDWEPKMNLETGLQETIKFFQLFD